MYIQSPESGRRKYDVLFEVDKKTGYQEIFIAMLGLNSLVISLRADQEQAIGPAELTRLLDKQNKAHNSHDSPSPVPARLYRNQLALIPTGLHNLIDNVGEDVLMLSRGPNTFAPSERTIEVKIAGRMLEQLDIAGFEPQPLHTNVQVGYLAKL